MFACIYIPDFPVEAIVRAEPLLRERAVAVLEGKPPVVRVVALNEKARLLGMEAGMTKLQAAVFAAPEEKSPAILRPRSPEQERSAHSALLDVAHAFTPRVEDTADDTLLLDLAGLERLHGAPQKMARDLASRVSAVGLEANIAIAANPDAALHAARGFNGVTVIPAGKEAQRLGVLPLPVLLDGFEISLEKTSAAKREREKFREQMLDTLERWGVRDFRTLALLPDHALASRLGEAGTRLQRLARGAGMRTLALCEPPSRFEEAMELESPVETLEPLSFILNRLLEQLCARLEARALAVQELHLRLQLERRVADEDTTTVQELERTLTMWDRRYLSALCGCRWPCAMPRCFSSCCSWSWQRIRRVPRSRKYGSRRSLRRPVRPSGGCFCQFLPRPRGWKLRWRASAAWLVSDGRELHACWIVIGKTAFAWIDSWPHGKNQNRQSVLQCQTSKSSHHWRCGCFVLHGSCRSGCRKGALSIWLLSRSKPIGQCCRAGCVVGRTMALVRGLVDGKREAK